MHVYTMQCDIAHDRLCKLQRIDFEVNYVSKL
jgi:hypothetical protein